MEVHGATANLRHDFFRFMGGASSRAVMMPRPTSSQVSRRRIGFPHDPSNRTGVRGLVESAED